MRVSIIGLGTVGQGVVELLRRHRALYEARCGHALDVAAVLVRDARKPREFQPPASCVVTDHPDEFFAVASDVVIEVAGGLEPARTNVRRAIESGRDVVTANKSLLAAHGPELFTLAETMKRRLLFEAAVAGGVPVIRGVAASLSSCRIERFAGILNGTCNFILTQMQQGNAYDAALREAQRLGFAEADPTLDVSGQDSMQKLSILATLAFDGHVAPRSITCEGITTLTATDLAEARRMGMALKLLAVASRGVDGTIELWNGPTLIKADHPLADVQGSEMGLAIASDAMPSAFFRGDGAGRFPTASAVVADVMEVARLWSCRQTAVMNPWPIKGSALRTNVPTSFATLPSGTRALRYESA